MSLLTCCAVGGTEAEGGAGPCGTCCGCAKATKCAWIQHKKVRKDEKWKKKQVQRQPDVRINLGWFQEMIISFSSDIDLVWQWRWQAFMITEISSIFNIFITHAKRINNVWQFSEAKWHEMKTVKDVLFVFLENVFQDGLYFLINHKCHLPVLARLLPKLKTVPVVVAVPKHPTLKLTPAGLAFKANPPKLNPPAVVLPAPSPPNPSANGSRQQKGESKT